MSADIVVRRARLADYLGLGQAFAELSRHAVEPNPHMSPAAISAATLLVPEEAIVILCAWRSEALGSESLVGVWALLRQRDWRTGFASVLAAPLVPLYEVSSPPVLDRDHAEDIALAMLRHLLAASDLPKTLALPLLPLEGRCFAALQEAMRITGSRLTRYETWQRPVMAPQPGDDAERYLRRALGSGYKKRMQQFRAIGKGGAVSFARKRGNAAREAFETFLALEAAGWKGEAGTAIACLLEDSAYFHRLVELLIAQDAVLVDALLLDGKPIAMGLVVESAGTRHFLKIAYDETQARHSPGRALTIAMLQADFREGPPNFFDSGAGDGVDAGTYVWGERRQMANAILTIGGAIPSRAHLAAGARMWLRRLRDRTSPH
ncbi:GNAT family N-acetyltransferase [Bosea caraganae]|uniref:GNAT family N-acetyltransferase n=1 Tax=Bosea caraganae TaxID=2763117 RepID=A0A370LAT1_9HYPH|nr:GNAT family N-acetyltransferase [Bosea caraganae]RDJ27044.1 GNAT family N-acetyltransferase [Bosea caraganae]RDJ29061.1 GNAT family N-acetyltransferase [Bosea caraganae]